MDDVLRKTDLFNILISSQILYSGVSVCFLLTKRMRFIVLSFFLLFLFLPSLTTDNLLLCKQNSIQDYALSRANNDSVDYLIITSEDFVSAAQPLATWKKQRGLMSSIVTIETISANYDGDDLAEKVRNCIIDYHSNHNALWVVLAGGEYVVPARTVEIDGGYALCDFYYSNLDDNWVLESDGDVTLIDADDWDAEVYVGRLPADFEHQLSSLVSRLIQYEKNPPVGSWMTHAVFAGTFCNFDRDLNHNDIFDEGDFGEFDTNRNHNWIKSNLLPNGWTSTLLAECEGLKTTDYPYDEQLNKTSLVDAINSGASIVMADAHGSSSGMYRTIFTHDQDGDCLFDLESDELQSSCFLDRYTDFNTEGKQAMYFLAACSTGTFYGRDCLTEYIVRTNGIGCIGSSGSAGYDSTWYDGEHLGWLSQGLSERFWEQLLVLGFNHPGKALALAKYDYALDRVATTGEDDGGRTLAQYNLMGDPEVPLWINIPSSFNEPEIEMVESSREIIIDIAGVSTATEGIFITLQGSNFYQRVLTQEEEELRFLLPDLPEPDNITITLSKNGIIPFQVALEVPAGSRGITYLPVMGSIFIIAAVVVVVKKVRFR